MKSPRLLGAIALLVIFLVALLAAAPARLLNSVIPGEQVQLSGVQGTLWRGSASRCMVKLAPGYMHLGAVQWTLNPLSLLTLSPRLNIQSDWGAQRLSGKLTLRSEQDIDLSDLEVQASAELVQQFAPLVVDGNIAVEMEELSLRDGLPHSANGRVVWSNGGFQSPRGRVALGTYALNISQEPGAPLAGEIVTVDGELEAEGTIELSGSAYSLNVLLRSDAPLQGQLKEALNLMATPEDGGYRLLLDATL